MKILNQALIKFILVCLFIVVSQAIHAEVLVGKVVGVSDGDTITVLDATKTEHKVRLMGIDAPEKSQDFGNQSKRALSDYIYQQEVTVEYKKSDKYKRKVGKVILDKQDVCLAMIELGMAWHYKDYEKEQSKLDRDLYSQAEIKAKTENRGLWQASNPIAPSSFRQMQSKRKNEDD
jgi:endonuclease YncB( thermonuclease family)